MDDDGDWNDDNDDNLEDVEGFEDVEDVGMEDATAEGEEGRSPPSSPCRRTRDTMYDLVPAEEGDDADSGDIEGQLIDVTCRDYALPTAAHDLDRHAFCRSRVAEGLDPTPVGLYVDMHMVDTAGRSVMVTVDRTRPFQPRVQFMSTDGAVDDTRSRELAAFVARRVGLQEDDLHAKRRILKRASLVGFDPRGGADPLHRQQYDVVSFPFDTAELAQKARRLQAAVRQLRFEVVDAKSDPVIEFLIDRNLEACGWVRACGAQRVPSHSRTSSAQVEATCAIDAVVPSERRSLAPTLVASYDIETYGSRGAGVFPDAEIPEDFICAITTNFWRTGTENGDAFNVVMVVGTDEQTHGSDTAVECFGTEREMLLAWSEMIRRVDPKILTGYNIYRFDNQYVATRAARLQERMFWHFGAYLGEPVEARPFKLESAAFGQNEGHTMDIRGKVVLDTMQYMMMNYKLPLYNLDFVAKQFLGVGKVDLDIPTMFRLVEAGQFSQLIKYVKVDGVRVQQLLRDRDAVNSIWAMSRATWTFPTPILTRGQQIRVMNKLRRTCATQGVAIRPPPETPKRRFIGARVVTPSKGYYDPRKGKVITLDFASLYPSIIRAYNICYQTYIDPRHVDGVRRRFPDLEIVEHELALGQVWEEVRGNPPGAIDVPAAAAAKFVDIAQKQLKKGYVEVALTDDEFEDSVRPMQRSLGESGGPGELTRHCFVTITDPSTGRPKRLRPKKVRHYFAKGVTHPDGTQTRCPSLLPQILEELGKLRKQAKKAMAAAEAEAARCAEEATAATGDDEAGREARREATRRQAAAAGRAALHDKEQLAYKVVMNSVYGFTAANMLRLLALAETITAKGREALEVCIDIAERVCAEMGFPESRVVYGDTDSIFVHVAGADSPQALDVGARISAECNARLERDTKSSVLKLEFEALFEGIVLVGKKTYAGLQHAVFEKESTVTRQYNGVEWTIEEHGMSAKPKKYKKGLRNVRRDTPPLVAKIQGESLDLLLETRSVGPVLEYIEASVMRLVRNEVPRSEFQITMQLKRECDYFRAEGDEVAKQPHLRLAKKLQARSASGTPLPQGCSLPGVGERVPYYYAETDDLVGCDRAECPVYGEAYNIPADRVHYFELIAKALDQGLSVMPEVKQLVERIKREHIAAIKKSIDRRRKLADERKRLAAAGQSFITGFLAGAGATTVPTAAGAATTTATATATATAGASKTPAPKKLKRPRSAQGGIGAFLG